MTDTTIKVDSAVRDRLALVAAERGVTMRSLIEEFAESLLTQHDLRERQLRAADYIKAHLQPDFDLERERAAGEELWANIAQLQSPAAPGLNELA